MRSIIGKTIFLTVLVVVAVGSAFAMIFYSFGLSNNGNDTISPNFGSSVGIHSITSKAGEPVSGLPSTTVTLHASPQNPTSALEYISSYLSQQNGNSTQRLNIHLIVDKSDGFNSGFDFTFYATSSKDYVDGTFKAATAELETFVDANPSSQIVFVSTPTVEGTRTVSVTDNTYVRVTANGQDLKSAWATFVAGAGKLPLDGSRYNLTMFNNTGDHPITVSGFFYDDSSLAFLTRDLPRVWSTLGTYSEKFGNFNFTGISYSFSQPKDSNSATFKLTIKGKQPDAGTIASMVKNFTKQAYGNYDIMLPDASITMIFYTDSKLPVWVGYPTNMLWPY